MHSLSSPSGRGSALSSGWQQETPPRLLTRCDVSSALQGVDPVETIEAALSAHAKGASDIPTEGYISWHNSVGAHCRSLAMLGGLTSKAPPVYGLKVINAALSNPDRGLERAGGCTFLFDYETGRPQVIAEAGLLSATRTAAYTLASIRRLGPAIADSITIIGCGALARVHCDLIVRHLPDVRRFVVFDLESSRMASVTAALEDASPSIEVRRASSAREAVESSNVVVTTTTTTTGYIEAEWFQPGSFVAHVSLDDLVPSVFFDAQAVYVDDIDLVRDNPRRILGRLLSEDGAGRIPLAGSFGEVIVGAVPAIRPSDGIVVSNPFGMAILDIALLEAVSKVAVASGLGRPLDLYGPS